MFIAALFTIAKAWKQLKCPSPAKGIKKICIHIHTLECCSGIKKSEMMPFTATRTNLDIHILREVSQAQKDKYHMILFTYGILKK